MAKGKNHQPGGAAAVVEALVRPTVEGFGLRLWDVRFEKEGPDWFLRVLIDRDEPLDTDTCEAVSRAIDPILDEADPIPDSYVFEVGSAGAERELKRPGDFEQFMGSEVEVRLYQPVNGCKVYVGVLAGYDNGRVTVTVGKNEVSFDKSQIALVKLHVSI